MHLAYFDETGTSGSSPIAMFGALVVPVGGFGRLSILHQTAIQQILPSERINEFKEFHAFQLYQGKGIFEGVDQSKRFTAIQVLLTAVRSDNLPFIYAAADRKKMTETPFDFTIDPLIAAFHMCLLGVEDWATANHADNFPRDPNTKVIDWKDAFLCILDDCSNRDLKEELKKTYRSLRKRYPFLPHSRNRLWHGHDNMFFADSSDCLGIQISDLCNYFVRRHLENASEPQNFYHIFAKQVICAKPEPEWQEHGHQFRSHR